MQISIHKRHRTIQLFILIAVLWCGHAMAQSALSTKAETSGSLEAGGLHHSLTARYQNWNGQFIRGVLRSDSNNVWGAEIVDSREFGDEGTLLVLENTHTFNDRWYSAVSASGSNGGFYLPRLRLDVTVSKKWLTRRNLVTSIGVTAVNAKDGHQDRSMLLSTSYYFDAPWVIEHGTRTNVSNPGLVLSSSSYVAATYGRDKQQIMSLRFGYGQEAYQYIGANAPIVNFKSQILTWTWRKWIRQQQGFQMRTEWYHNQYYDRRGIEVSAFKEF